LVLMAASLACQLGGNGGTTPVDSNVLYQDDFSNPNSGWDSVRDDTAITDYENGGYRIFVNEANYDYWATAQKSFDGDVVIDVDATKTAGPDDNDFGVICRYNSPSDGEYNYYFFMISSDGYASIGKSLNGERSNLSGDSMQAFDGINPGSEKNHITASCIGNTLTLSVNGNQLISVQDDSFNGGDVGLLAGTFDVPGVDILFDNFVVTKP
jgi:hypothetical protein